MTCKNLPYDATIEYHRNGVGGQGYYTIALDVSDDEMPARMLAIVPIDAVYDDEDGWLLSITTHIPELLLIDPAEVGAFASKSEPSAQLLNWRGADYFSLQVLEILHAYAPDLINPAHKS
jgi:hypothetical protein